jgi:hypothetical protein
MGRWASLVLGAAAGAWLAAPAARAGLPAPPVFKWQRCPVAYCETGWYASPAAADVDGDGQIDALWGGYTLLAVNGASGALEWSYAAPGGGRIWSDVAVSDVRGDHHLEVVAAFYGDLLVLDGRGAPQSGWPKQPFAGDEMRTLAVADLDGDGAREILVARAAGVTSQQWSVLEPSGSTRAGWPRRQPADPGSSAGCFNQNLAVADLDGDGKAEVIFTTWTQKDSGRAGELKILDYQGNELASVALPHAAGHTWGALGAPTLANIDSDPDLEVLVGTADAGLVAYDLPGTGGARVLWGTGRGNLARTAPEPDALASGWVGLLALAGLAAASRKR